MDAVDSVVDPLREFAKDSVRLVKRCHKPDRKGLGSWIVFLGSVLHVISVISAAFDSGVLCSTAFYLARQAGGVKTAGCAKQFL
ncbi:hypothetical protein ABZP36_022038 [Zizania latifolia]